MQYSGGSDINYAGLNLRLLITYCLPTRLVLADDRSIVVDVVIGHPCRLLVLTGDLPPVFITSAWQMAFQSVVSKDLTVHDGLRVTDGKSAVTS